MKNKEEMTATISASIGLFDFLKEKVGERKTRTEAYCDLLDKSLAGFVSPFLRNQDFELRPRQCHVTVSPRNRMAVAQGHCPFLSGYAGIIRTAGKDETAEKHGHHHAPA